jgi:predicted TIM-barrel fold metal-dependent hydrolase
MSTGWKLHLCGMILSCLVLTTARAQEFPIFDAHIHYNRPDWQVFTPEQILAILDQAGIQRALVSSTPDDGTLQLYAAAPQRIVPFLRPYRTREDMASWPSDPAVQAYVEERLTRGIYKGIGEFHLSTTQADAPTVRRFAALAAQQQLFFHAHVDDSTLEKLLRLYPQVRILWAHAGMSAPAATVGRLLEQSANLWVELSLRFDIASDGRLAPAWRTVLLKHPDRLMVGTDTWTTSRWNDLVSGMQSIRSWLDQLPREVTERIAYRNAEHLFGKP